MLDVSDQTSRVRISARLFMNQAMVSSSTPPKLRLIFGV
jgi:hypothetical protein